MQPSEEDIKHWQEIARKRNAILPYQFIRPLIVGQNDPVYVCPSCQSRNYIPIDWNTIRGYGKRKY